MLSQFDSSADRLEIEAPVPGHEPLPRQVAAHTRICPPHGGWYGLLPIWPFERPQPGGVDRFVGGTGLECVLERPGAAYPMIAPTIQPLSPAPAIGERTQATWHVLPAGGLCLLQSTGRWWVPEASITDLLLKAAGWRIEYALMKVIERMSESGIVSDAFLRIYLLQASAGCCQSAGWGRRVMNKGAVLSCHATPRGTLWTREQL